MGKKYRLSDYLTVVTREDECLLAQGILGETMIMKKELFDKVAGNLNEAGSPEIEEAKKRLMAIDAIVPEDSDEQKLIEDIFSCDVENGKIICKLSLVLTLRCNFACPYCFENEKKEDMEKEVIDKALDYLFEKAKRDKPETLTISFYGGEPLLRFDMLEYAVIKTREFCMANNIRPQFYIATNGSLFTQKVADLFSSEGDLDSVQTVLDGPRDVHDRRRFFKGGKGSYEVIMKNLPLMFKAAKVVQIRINIDKENEKSISGLFRELEKFKTNNLRISLAHITNSYGKGMSRKKATPIPDFDRLEKKYYEEAEKLGLRTEHSEQRLLDYKPVDCIAAAARPRLIAPDGEIYCCAMVVGDRLLSVGNVFTGYDEERSQKWLKYNIINSKKCIGCKHIFFCGGPCLARAMRDEADMPFCGNGFRNFLEQNFDKIKRSAISVG
jgi:uncharacterized protein